MISMPAISQSSAPPKPGKSLDAKVTKIAFGSASAEFDSAFAPSTTTKAIGTSV
jgi:hypothetical protein